MNTFERAYIVNCLTSIKTILSNPQQKAQAITDYTEGKLGPRHLQPIAPISDAEDWTSTDILCFNAAVFAAVAETNENYPKNEQYDKLALAIFDAKELLLTIYVPLIAKKNTCTSRCSSIIENITQLIEQLTAAPESTHLVEHLSHTFFKPVVTRSNNPSSTNINMPENTPEPTFKSTTPTTHYNKNLIFAGTATASIAAVTAAYLLTSRRSGGY